MGTVIYMILDKERCTLWCQKALKKVKISQILITTVFFVFYFILITIQEDIPHCMLIFINFLTQNLENHTTEEGNNFPVSFL